MQSIGIKTILVHTVTYFVIGFISFTLFDYTAKYADPLLGNYMRQTDHPLVAAGTLFQVIHGLVYTNVPFYFHIIGLPEVTIQSLLLAFCTHYWVKHPEKKWLAWLFGAAFVIAILFSILGILAAMGMINVPTG